MLWSEDKKHCKFVVDKDSKPSTKEEHKNALRDFNETWKKRMSRPTQNRTFRSSGKNFQFFLLFQRKQLRKSFRNPQFESLAVWATEAKKVDEPEIFDLHAIRNCQKPQIPALLICITTVPPLPLLVTIFLELANSWTKVPVIFIPNETNWNADIVETILNKKCTKQPNPMEQKFSWMQNNQENCATSIRQQFRATKFIILQKTCNVTEQPSQTSNNKEVHLWKL